MRLGISSGLIYDNAEKWAKAHKELGLEALFFLWTVMRTRGL